MFNVDTLFLNDEYTVNVKVDYSLNYPISGVLKISSNKILLEVYGEMHDDSAYNYHEYFDSLKCTNFLNSTFRLLGVQLVSSHQARLSETRGSFNHMYEVKEILYNNGYIMDDIKFYDFSFQSEDIVKWIGNTKIQQTIIDNYYTKTLSNVDNTELMIDLEDFHLIIFYPITTYSNSPEQKAGINFSPVIRIQMKEESTFEVIKEKYQELLNLFYLLLGYDIKVSQVLLHSNYNNTISYYYNQDLDRKYDNYLFLHLGHNIRFEQNSRDSLPLSIFQNYFKLTQYQKRLFSYYRKYKRFDYSEENFLGFYRILENIMFSHEEITEEMKTLLLLEENRADLKEFYINKCKKLKDCIAYIKFLVFYHQLDTELKEDLRITKQNIRDMVKLRHDITHFNEYDVGSEQIREYAIFLEFLSTYSLLRLLDYPKEQFHNNIRFYANYHTIRKQDEV